jgi:uncharacterized protein involved in exopolysaccharide biosynthesis
MNGDAQRQPDPYPREEISLAAVANAVLRSWRLVVAVPLILAFAAGAATLLQERRFVASSAFLPETSGKQGLSGATALAVQFGVSLDTEPAQSPQFYAGLIRSRTLLRQVVETNFDLVFRDGSRREGTLMHLYGMDVAPASVPPPWLEAVEETRKRIRTAIHRETGLVTFSVTAADPALAEAVAAKLLERVNAFNVASRQARAEEEIRFIGERLQEAGASVSSGEAALLSFLVGNRDFRNSPELGFEHERLQRDVAMWQNIYTSLLRSQEQERIDAVRDTRTIVVIDHPSGSAEPAPRGTIRFSGLAFSLGLLLAAAIAVVRDHARSRREESDADYAELRDLARSAWQDVRRPRQWLKPRVKR